jgi:prolyl-tRNA editing enzyme YbaK/EbsC (Cys-tRNA(Pro) deacylase)
LQTPPDRSSRATTISGLLDELAVDHVIKPHRRAALTAEAAAAERGVRLAQVVKCMVGTADGEQLVVMLIPGDRRLKSSRARKHLRARSLEFLPREVLESELGLVVGAISPLQLIGRATMLMDPSVLDEELVDISSGDPMAGIELKASDLREVLAAELVPIAGDTVAE